MLGINAKLLTAVFFGQWSLLSRDCPGFFPLLCAELNMLHQLTVNNFKCLGSCSFALKPLTLFCGSNSSGKSTALQAILLASDNVRKLAGEHNLQCSKYGGLDFNAYRCFVTNDKSFDIGISCKSCETLEEEPLADDPLVHLSFRAGDDSFSTTVVDQSGDTSASLLDCLSRERLFYLPASRPAIYDVNLVNPDGDNKFGFNGDYVLDYYVKHRHDVLDDDLVVASGTKTIEGQVNCLLDRLASFNLIFETVGNHHYVTYRTRSGKELKPSMVGSGISNFAQILIACLSLPKGAVLSLEHPELFFSAKVQAQLIDVMAMVALSGRQIIIESHSDHVFNGIRRLISQGMLSLDDVAVYNFTQDEQGLSSAQAVKLTKLGGLEERVEGLFDQFDNDLDDILML